MNVYKSSCFVNLFDLVTASWLSRRHVVFHKSYKMAAMATGFVELYESVMQKAGKSFDKKYN